MLSLDELGRDKKRKSRNGPQSYVLGLIDENVTAPLHERPEEATQSVLRKMGNLKPRCTQRRKGKESKF